MGCPASCGSAGSGASADARGNSRRRARCCARAAGPSIGCRKKCSKVEPLEALRIGASPADRPASARCRASAPARASALGLTQIQSMPAGGGSVPLVSTRDREARACSASISGCVELQQRLAAGADDKAAARSPPRASARRPPRPAPSASANLPPPGAVGADEIGVAEAADRARRGPPRGPSTGCSRRSGRTPPARPAVRALALQRVEDLLDRVGHAAGASRACRA